MVIFQNSAKTTLGHITQVPVCHTLNNKTERLHHVVFFFLRFTKPYPFLTKRAHIVRTSCFYWYKKHPSALNAIPNKIIQREVQQSHITNSTLLRNGHFCFCSQRFYCAASWSRHFLCSYAARQHGHLILHLLMGVQPHLLCTWSSENVTVMQVPSHVKPQGTMWH